MPVTGPTAQNNPDLFMGRAVLSGYEPYPLLNATSASSVATNNIPVVRWFQPQAVGVKNVIYRQSLSPGVPGATSQASTGSQGLSYAVSAFAFTRQDYSANSTNLSFVQSGSFGLSASLGYSSTSQVFGMSWVTDASGGISNLTTTSGDAGWSVYANSMRVISIPFPATTFTAGEYFMGFQYATTSATSNSNITLLSMSHMQLSGPAAATAVFLGDSAAGTTMGPHYGLLVSAAPVLSNTFAAGNIRSDVRAIWFALSNA